MKVAIVDTGLCNVDSMLRALEECGADARVTDAPADLAHVDKIVLPGVGAFPDAMERLESTGLADAIREQAGAGTVPLLGVCLGMQLLATRGTEVRDCDGLGLIDATVQRLASARGERIPHVGWNEVHRRGEPVLLDGIPDGRDFYFVHSFHLHCTNPADSVAATPYCGGFTSMVQRDHVLGAQFHPEKSQGYGLALLKNFVAL